jgi:hypothetical protein
MFSARAKIRAFCLTVAALLVSCTHESTSDPYVEVAGIPGQSELADQTGSVLDSYHIHSVIFGSEGYSVDVPLSQSAKATEVLKEAKEKYGYDWLLIKPSATTSP